MVKGVNTGNGVALAEVVEGLGIKGLLAPGALLRGQLTRGEVKEAFNFTPPLDRRGRRNV